MRTSCLLLLVFLCAAILAAQMPSVPAKNAASISALELKVPEAARKAFEKGMRAYARGKTNDARANFEKALALYPHYAKAHNNLGVLYFKLEEREKATEHFSKAVEEDPYFAAAFLNLAKIAYGDDNYDEAELRLEKALSLDPNATDARALLVTVAYMKKEYEKALSCAVHVHQTPKHEKFAEVHYIAGRILEVEGKRDEARREFQDFVKEAPADPRVPAARRTLEALASGAR